MDNMDITPEENVPNPRRIRYKNLQGTVLSYLHDLVFLLAGLLLVFVLLFRMVVVVGPSMRMTLVDGDYLLVLGSTFYRNPEQGDVLVASKDNFNNGEPIVKRVIAKAGQTVDIDFELGTVYVDGEALVESYTLTPTNLQEGVTFPLTVDEGYLFVMGDNRNESKDSRHPEIGLIDEREVLGRVLLLLLPGKDPVTNKRDFSRFGAV